MIKRVILSGASRNEAQRREAKRSRRISLPSTSRHGDPSTPLRSVSLRYTSLRFVQDDAVRLMALTIAIISFFLSSCQAQTHSTINPDSLASKIKDIGDEHIRMPALPLNYSADRYINVKASELTTLMQDKIVLLDIWDYTCVNCIRTLPYIQSWHEKYADKGLVIIGIHTPEFEFAKERTNVEREMQRFGLSYPVILDNDYDIWDSLANRYWPAKYIFDTKRKMRAEHFGEGEYHEFEAFIQKLLLEREPTLTMPELTPIVSEVDKPGAVCYRQTPELYLGFERERYDSETEIELNKPKHYKANEPHAPDSVALEGKWEVRRQFARPAGGDNSRLIVNYQAKDVNLVIRPEEGSEPFRVYVDQDFGPLQPHDRGADIREENGRTFILVEQPRMYQIVSNKRFNRYTLTLSTNSPQFCAYAFTFTTDCIPPEEE